ncbi:aminodeoxychorismate lyase [Corynebacterium sp. 320]|uniref:aminodeoxychorismate lyase n=1 Tax=Corynebacterium TaxID=1716 RepID=UPI00125CAFDA|nr:MULTISPECIES: aminodeoxychorismate lyase [Corynebacterium]KAB1503000.1 aminodeoxychorismate lyase [Corynebacterium sp. 320]KAB1550789.1 aminodeoxychorismate lyase [Corynebacterium sp. 321]KAB1551146.1 aminodeoxychorismate lyase [Corynebacterium sp. 319]KAB3526797.1 aminodeoxychorismate lyase [Corynebacterium sp. 250]KAB3538292.1 aminodeoxychorismate lyase [Corynebacterium sp. 366]
MSSHLPSQLVLDVLGTDTPHFVDADAPFIYSDDLAAVRGDGIFETLMLRDGDVKNVELHFHRFVNSSAMLDLDAPDRETWLKATELAAEEFTRRVEQARAHGEDVPNEAALRWVYSRGRESTGAATGWITISPAWPQLMKDRAEGVRVMTAERGFRIDLSQRSPWALVGAKTLSYAANMAALRYAKSHDFDDVIFVSDEGLVLEGPTSTVIGVDGKTLVSPPVEAGILPGTTQAALFKVAEARGWTVEYRPLTVEELTALDGVWLVSSVRVQARVTHVDGHEMPRPSCAEEIEAMAWEAVS